MIHIPMRKIQKNNISKFHLFHRFRNTLKCYLNSNTKTSFILKYNQEWRTLLLKKNIDHTYIDFSICMENKNKVLVINKFYKYIQKDKIKYIFNESNLHDSNYCKYSLKNIISEILHII
jgi:hypothetical protein